MKIGDITTVYGQKCRVYRIHGMGTVDVETLEGGQCYRVSGLPLSEPVKQTAKDAKDDANASAIEAYWQAKQGEDYGSY